MRKQTGVLLLMLVYAVTCVGQTEDTSASIEIVVDTLKSVSADTVALINPSETNEGPEESEKQWYLGIRLVNGQTTQTLPKKRLEFCIQHRFGPFSSGASNFYGLDQSTIRFGLDYGITDKLTVGLGRSSFSKTYNAFAKLALTDEDNGGMFNTTLLTDMNINGSKNTSVYSPYYFSHRLNYTNQIIFSKTLLRQRLFVQLSPTVIHRNFTDSVKDPNDLLLMVISARVKITSKISLTGEYNYQFYHDYRKSRYPAAGMGIEFYTAGHIFQITFANTTSMNEANYMLADNGNFAKGRFGLGFNIVRRW